MQCLELSIFWDAKSTQKAWFEEKNMFIIWKCWKFLIFCEKTELLLSSWPLKMTIIQTSTTFFPYELEAWLKKLKFTKLNFKVKTTYLFSSFPSLFSRKLHRMKNAATCVEKNVKNFIISFVFHEIFVFLDSLWKTLEPSKFLFFRSDARFGRKIKIFNLKIGNS